MMNIARKLACVLLPLGLLLSASIASADVVVIVNASSPIKTATSDDIAKLFLGRISSLDGVDLTPVDQKEGTSARHTFYSKVVGKTPAQLNAYWSRLIFTGKGSPPRMVGDDSEVADAVADDDEAIGYIDSSAVRDGVKVIYTVK